MSGKFRIGDVVRYTPERTWCREGWAVARGRLGPEEGAFVDTFWGGGAEQHTLTPDEVATIEGVEFNLDDVVAFTERPGTPEWLDYDPEDRFSYPAQHGLRQHLFIRAGAKPTSSARIDRLRAERDEARADFESATAALIGAEQRLYSAMIAPLEGSPS